MPAIAALPVRTPAAAVLLQGAGVTASAGRAPPTAAALASAAPFRGFGYVQYVGGDGAVPLQLAAAAATAIGMPPDDGQTLDGLRGPFAGWRFWSGTALAARAVGDVYLVRLTVTATSPVGGGGVTAQALVHGAAVPIDTAHCPLTAPPGEAQVLTFKFTLVPKQTFVSGGASILVASSVPLAILAQKLVIAPVSVG